jgi:hypothetical protein
MLLVLFLALLVLAGCATQPELPGSDLPGFFMGFAHGFIDAEPWRAYGEQSYQ